MKKIPFKATGKTKTEQEILSRQNEIKYEYKVFGITLDREKLYHRINLRVDSMIEKGFSTLLKESVIFLPTLLAFFDMLSSSPSAPEASRTIRPISLKMSI